MTDPIEAMARAMCAHEGFDPDKVVFREDGSQQRLWETREFRGRAYAARDAHLAALSETHLIVPLEGLVPAAVRYDFDGYGYRYLDSGSGSDWQARHADGETLYTLEGIKP